MNKGSKIVGKNMMVTIEGIVLDPQRSRGVRDHSPDGFNLGNYGGSGPSQLALALLLEATDQNEAVLLYIP